jgi:hypothetical protein
MMPDRLEEIERRLKRLEDSIFPSPSPSPSMPWLSPKVDARCPNCGIDFSGITGYVCPSTACPIQPRVT